MREHTYTFVQWARGCIVAFVGAVFGATFGVFCRVDTDSESKVEFKNNHTGSVVLGSCTVRKFVTFC